ncbi:Ger(x)C family spore germination protein [Paenibacillus sp. p3-SID867]|uniref:Ger(x)C family spore germination protein n=1 Tax=Paenibacillus sp. p3-SID867 TaxID=2916363 RepID=UPI0021A582E9|nr:Ger(x)C family spore germination protein [Paenibacillus sp. p3-SID867]MCT1401094.1 Ger(x)C family spore germination protein [Paenibacillus sp. p3-SID867]
MRRAALLLLSLLLLSGCEDQRILEKLGFILAVSFDMEKTKSEEDTLKIGFSIPRSQQDKQIFISTLAQTYKNAILNLSRENNYELVNGQLRLILFSKEYAQSGLDKQLDTFERDPKIAGNAKLIVVDGDAGDLLSKDLPQYDQTGLFLNNMLETVNKVHLIPLADIYTFTRDLYDDGIDPVIPVLKASSEKIQITGIGLFHDARYIDKLDPMQFPIFSLLQGTFNGGALVMRVNEETDKAIQISLNHIYGKRKVNVTLQHPIQTGHDVKIMIDFNIKGALTEYTGSLDLDNPQNQVKLESLMNKYLEQEVAKVIRSFQELKVDPIGLGKFVRIKTTYPEWKANDWRDIFESAEITVKSNVKIRNYGKVQE